MSKIFSGGRGESGPIPPRIDAWTISSYMYSSIAVPKLRMYMYMYVLVDFHLTNQRGLFLIHLQRDDGADKLASLQEIILFPQHLATD